MSYPHDHDHIESPTAPPDFPHGADDLHGWFGLSYANYLTLPRSLMRSMPDEWQGRMAALLREMGEMFPGYQQEGTYIVQLRDDAGWFVPDRLAPYRYPDRGYIESLRQTSPSVEGDDA